MIKATARYKMRENPANDWVELWRLSASTVTRVWRKIALRYKDPSRGSRWIGISGEPFQASEIFKNSKSWDVGEAEATMILFSIQNPREIR